MFEIEANMVNQDKLIAEVFKYYINIDIIQKELIGIIYLQIERALIRKI